MHFIGVRVPGMVHSKFMSAELTPLGTTVGWGVQFVAYTNTKNLRLQCIVRALHNKH